MRKTLLFGTGAAIGFLMGARAGRPTYDSIMQNLQAWTRRDGGSRGGRGGGMSPTTLDLTDSGLGRSSDVKDRLGRSSDVKDRLGRSSDVMDRLGRSSEAMDRASAAASDWLGTGDAMPPGDLTTAPVAGTQEHFGGPRPGL